MNSHKPIPSNPGETRRGFLKKVAMAGATLSGTRLLTQTQAAVDRRADLGGLVPWYRRITRWGQTNITEIDPIRYDIAWWREYWRRTQTQGVVINAGGIVAYYPSAVPFHHPAEYLNGRDLFGELRAAAKEEGLVVFARMDSNRAHSDCYQAHPDWFAVDASGKPYKAGDL
ncbi:MAG TPA: twin-arginine translocation signal domain-containing protein, partial [Verrucomicrobiae bacterium]|nr:twin-arginine translocation signal domain-containing protein [Verrucomicrobiae bacterium]